MKYSGTMPLLSFGAPQSPAPMLKAVFRWEISRLRVSIKRQSFILIPACGSARDDMCGGQLTVILKISEPICIRGKMVDVETK